MAVKWEQEQAALTVHLAGELDHHTAHTLREEIDGLVERLAPQCLRLDFREVAFMDSSGVGLVMGRYRLMRSRDGTLLVDGMSERIAAMMRMAGLDRLDIWPPACGRI